MDGASRKSAQILPTHTPALFDAAVRRAAAALRGGEPVALPTETVYGLAANALDAEAVARVFAVKGRPGNNPVIVHVADREMAKQCVREWPLVAERLAAAFWPGPLTLVLPRAEIIPDAVTAGGSTVGVRWPSHPVILAVIRACGFPLAAPSANPSSRVSPTNAEHVRRGLGDKIRLIVDGGQSQVGVESTVLEIAADPPRLLRPGMIHLESLVAVTGKVIVGQQARSSGLRSPGLLLKHYSPKARLVVWPWRDDAELAARLAECAVPPRAVQIIAHTRVPAPEIAGGISVIPHDAEAFARAIYAELHRCDETGAKLIVVESLPTAREWRAIADRLSRAAT